MNKRFMVAMIPIIMVNGISIAAQYEFWRAHLPWPALAALFFAISLESLAVFTAYHASLAEQQNDSAMRLRLMSYALGLIIGLLNASHYLNHGNITAAAVGVGILSASSPWLWAVDSHRRSRDKLRENGLIGEHSVRLGAPRWLWHFRNSLSVYRMAVWVGETSPETAISAWENREPEPEPQQERMSLASVASKTDAIRVGLRELPGRSAPEIAAWLRERGWGDVTDAYVRTVRSADARRAADIQRAGIHAITSGHESNTGS